MLCSETQDLLQQITCRTVWSGLWESVEGVWTLFGWKSKQIPARVRDGKKKQKKSFTHWKMVKRFRRQLCRVYHTVLLFHFENTGFIIAKIIFILRLVSCWESRRTDYVDNLHELNIILGSVCPSVRNELENPSTTRREIEKKCWKHAGKYTTIKIKKLPRL